MSLDELRWLDGVLSRGDPAAAFTSLKEARGTARERLAALEADFRRLAARCDPARFEGAPSARALAEDVSARLEALYQEALLALDGPGVGARPAGTGAPYREPAFAVSYRGAGAVDFTVSTPRGSYKAGAVLARGDLATVYRGECVGGEHLGAEVVLKIADDAADNDLLLDEARALSLFEATSAPQKKQLPALLDQFMADGRAGEVLSLVEGFDLIAVLERYPRGVPPEHAIWMLRRLLSVVGFGHSQGVIHGNVEPSHVVIRPRDHNVTLIDWSYSIIAPAKSGRGFKCLNPDYSAPEVAEKKPPLPASDLYSVGRCAITLLGGDLRSGALPEHVDERLGRFVKYLTRPSPLQRAQDAWEMYEELGRLRKELYGPHRFIAFEM